MSSMRPGVSCRYTVQLDVRQPDLELRAGSLGKLEAFPCARLDVRAADGVVELHVTIRRQQLDLLVGIRTLRRYPPVATTIDFAFMQRSLGLRCTAVRPATEPFSG